MKLFSEKWQKSSIFTKITALAMTLDALLLFICAIMFFILSGMTGNSEAAESGVLYLFLFLFNALLAFGLIKVNRVAKIAVIVGGLCIAFPIILVVITWILSLTQVPALKNLMNITFGLFKFVFSFGTALVPTNAKALLVFVTIVFIGPYILNLLAMLILLFRGNDFKNLHPTKKSKLIAYILWFFLGFVSAHHFYLGKDGKALVYFFTGQFIVFGWVFNVFTLGKQVDQYNANLTEPAEIES